MDPFVQILDRSGADPEPYDPNTYAGECPCCGRARYLHVYADPFERKALAYCVSGGDGCTPEAVAVGLRLSPDAWRLSNDDGTVRLEVPFHPVATPKAVGGSSWDPEDFEDVLSGDFEPLKPNLLTREDGVALLYAGKTHSIYGESESGKSWIALIAAAEALRDGKAVLFVDFESSRDVVVGRLFRNLAVPAESLRQRFTYLRPGEAPTMDAAKAAFERILCERYALAVIDGTTDALRVFGLDPNVSTEVSTFLDALPKRIAEETGAAVVMIDHVVKSNNGAGRFAIGSQHKMAGLTGAAYLVEPITPIAPGRAGTLTVKVTKDRPGFVRAHAGAYKKSERSQEAARVRIDSTEDVMKVEILVGADDDEDTVGRRGEDTAALVAVYEAVRRRPGCSRNAVKTALRGSKAEGREGIGNDRIHAAIEALVNRDLLLDAPGPRDSRLLTVNPDVTPESRDMGYLTLPLLAPGGQAASDVSSPSDLT